MTDPRKHPLVIVVGSGGVGKTTATANLAVALAARGQRVVAIDADIGLRNLDMVMGLENRIVYDLVDVVEGRCRLRQAMVRDKRRTLSWARADRPRSWTLCLSSS